MGIESFSVCNLLILHCLAKPLDSNQNTRSRFALLPESCELGITRLDYGVNEIATLVIGQEGALHRVDSDLFEVLQGQTKGISSRLEFFGHGRVAHQPVVGVEGDAKFLLIQEFKGMFGQATCSACMDVA